MFRFRKLLGFVIYIKTLRGQPTLMREILRGHSQTSLNAMLCSIFSGAKS